MWNLMLCAILVLSFAKEIIRLIHRWKKNSQNAHHWKISCKCISNIGWYPQLITMKLAFEVLFAVHHHAWTKFPIFLNQDFVAAYRWLYYEVGTKFPAVSSAHKSDFSGRYNLHRWETIDKLSVYTFSSLVSSCKLYRFVCTKARANSPCRESFQSKASRIAIRRRDSEADKLELQFLKIRL